METASIQTLRAAIRDVPDFPKPGILFKDITPILADAPLFQAAINLFINAARPLRPEKIVGIDARGFVFGAAVAYALGIGFVPVRKKGKLPFQCEAAAYALEYGEAIVEIHTDALRAGERVIIIDDLLATGGTAAAASQLVRQLGAELLEIQFLVELTFLEGAARLEDSAVRSFLKF